MVIQKNRGNQKKWFGKKHKQFLLLIFQLFTHVDHGKFKFILQTLNKFCFKGALRNYTGVTKFGGRYVDDKKKYKIIFAKAKLRLPINCYLNNCHLTVGMEIHLARDLDTFWLKSSSIYWKSFSLLLWKKFDLELKSIKSAYDTYFQ